MRRKKSNKNNYLEELNEWQEHQYDPGYYTEGKIPPTLKNDGNSPLLGWGLLYSGIGGALIILLTIWKLTDTSELLKTIAAASLWEVLVVAMLIGGLRSLKRAYAHNKKAGIRAIRKNIIVFTIILCLITSVEMGAHTMGQVQEEIYINSTPQFWLVHTDGKSYIHISDRNMDILCSEQEIIEFRKFKFKPEYANYKYIITFK